MDIPESWGNRADAVVACLMAACALALALCGLATTYQCPYVMPYVLLFFGVELLWWMWIAYSLLSLQRDGHFSHAAWHVAIAIPLACLGFLSLICVTTSQCSHQSPLLSGRIFEKIFFSLQWWYAQ